MTASAAELVRDAGTRLVGLLEGPGGPRLAWTLRDYRAGRLQNDVTAGLTLAALILPLSIGYAAVAGLPPEMGLYASIAPLLAYAVMGSSRTLVVGPDAASASIIAAAIAPLAASPDDRVRLAGALGLVVAGIFLAMRLLRLGFLADLLSRPILVGYLAGVGITVALGQFPKILGGPVLESALSVLGRVDWTSADMGAVADATVKAVKASGADVVSALLGVSVLAAMLLGRRALPRVPMALVVMVVAVALSWALGLQGRGVQVLGPVQGGWPPIGAPSASLSEVLNLLPGAVGLALLSFADTAATGKTFAARRGERTDPNRELAALSLADAAAAVTGGYPISSSASRTSAVDAAGAATQLAHVVAAAAVLVALLLLTGPLSYLPTPALGAVILVSAMGIVDISALRAIWRLKPSEGVIALVALSGVILYGTLAGVAVAVLLAALNIVRRAAVPPIVEVGRRADGTWRDLSRWGDAQRVAGVAVVRFAGPLFFASVPGLDVRVRELIATRPGATVVVLDLGATSDLDITASDALRQLASDMAKNGRRLVVARPLGHVRDALGEYGLGDLLTTKEGEADTVERVVAGLGLAGPPAADEAEEAEETALPVGAAALPALGGSEGGPSEAAGPGAATAAAATGEPGSQPPGEREPQPPLEGNRLVLRVLAITGGAVVAAGVLSLVLGAVGGGLHLGPAPVPNLVGLPLPRAEVAAGDAGFVLATPAYVPRADWPEGTVVGQAPTAGATAARGSEIQPIVSTGRPLVEVPDVVGATESQAILVLTNAGFAVRRTYTMYDPEVPAGSIVSTNPAAGAQQPAGTVVEYAVSLGPEPTPSAPPSAMPSPSPTLAPGPTVEPSASPPAGPSPSEASPAPSQEPSPMPPSPEAPTPAVSASPAASSEAPAAAPPGTASAGP